MTLLSRRFRAATLLTVLASSLPLLAAPALPTTKASTTKASKTAKTPSTTPLWTDLDKKVARPLVAATSLAPVVQQVEPAVLVVFTEGPATSEGLPPATRASTGLVPPCRRGIRP